MLLIIILTLSYLCVVIAVAFYTLLERKILGYSQIRLGPNKARFKGLLQPFADAIKLIFKLNFLPSNSNMFIYLLNPCMFFIIYSMALFFIPSSIRNVNSINNSMFMLMFLLSLSAYPFFLIGYSRNSGYALLGCFRGLAQVISYESVFFFILIFHVIILSYKNISHLFSGRYFFSANIIFLVLFIIFIIIAETNRAPFDFAEGESELVRGYNVEYGSIMFTVIFLREYMALLIISILMSMILFINLGTYWFILFIFVNLIVLIRTSYPRFRFDFIMNMSWNTIILILLFLYMLVFNLI